MWSGSTLKPDRSRQGQRSRQRRNDYQRRVALRPRMAQHEYSERNENERLKRSKNLRVAAGPQFLCAQPRADGGASERSQLRGETDRQGAFDAPCRDYIPDQEATDQDCHGDISFHRQPPGTEPYLDYFMASAIWPADGGTASRAASLFVSPEKRRYASTLTGGRGGPSTSQIPFTNDHHPRWPAAGATRSTRREPSRSTSFFLNLTGRLNRARGAKCRPSETRRRDRGLARAPTSERAVSVRSRKLGGAR